MMHRLIVLLAICSLIACKDKWEDSALLGKWNTVSWTEKLSGKSIGNKMDFHFMEAGKYDVDYGSVQSSGKYWIANEYLHTVENGKVEIKVLIVNLNQDSLVLELNRGGVLETMVLLKQ